MRKFVSLIFCLTLGLSMFGFSTTARSITIEWIKLTTDSGRTVAALYGFPEKEAKHPAVIYNHGTIVRKLGYEETAGRGYDVRQFVKALVQAGFVALAPVREEGRLALIPGDRPNIMGGSPREWDDAIREGIRVTEAGLRFLKEQPNVSGKRLSMIGFSEGGLITLWAAFDRKDLSAIVLMSPANIGESPKFYFGKAAKTLDKVAAPMFLTLGRQDIRKIISNCRNLLIPEMNRLDKEFEFKIDYPGNHKWFWQVRAKYWKDIIRFLNKHLVQ